MSIKAEAKKALEALLVAENKTIDGAIFDKAWAKYGREAANYGQSAAERAGEDVMGVVGVAHSILGFYRETANGTTKTYNRHRAAQYGKSIIYA